MNVKQIVHETIGNARSLLYTLQQQPFQEKQLPTPERNSERIMQAESDDLKETSPAPPLHGRYASLINFLIRHRLALLLIAAALTLAAFPIAQRLTLERSIESLFAPDDPLLLDYQESKSLFGGDEFVIVAWKQPDLLETSGLKSVENLKDKLKVLPGVNTASTQALPEVLRPKGMGFLGSLFLRMPSVRKQALEFSEGMLIGEDRETTSVVLRLKSEQKAAVSRADTFAQIRQLAHTHDPPAYVVGEPVQVHDMFEIVERDGSTLGWATSFILLVIIFLLFRSFRWMLLPLLIVQCALLWTKAGLVLGGFRLSMVSSMLNSLVTIIGIATVMHITIYYRELREKRGREESLRQVLIELLPAITWACCTTAIGFGALLTSQIIPIQSFGLMMSMGVLLSLIAVVLIIPGGVLTGRLDADPRQYRWESIISHALLGILSVVLKAPRTILVLAAALFLFGMAGFQYLKVETDFSRNFRDESQIVKALNFVEANLGGAGSYEVNFSFPDIGDEQARDQLRDLAADLRELEVGGQKALTKVIVLTDGLDFIPNIAARTFEQKQELLDQMQPEFIPGLYNSEQRQMRIMLRALERLPAELKLEMVDEVTRTAKEYFPDAKATGLYVLLANIILSLLNDQLVSFSCAAIGILIMMSLAFRNWKIGLISLVPNLFPIIVLIGGLGWLGSLINIGTAMIASVSIGLTVDSSIHYLSSYFRCRDAGENHLQALRTTQGRVGLSLTYSNLALVCGFSVLTISEFVPLVYFGVLVSIAMLGGLIGNLVLLPLLLTWLFGRSATS